MFFDKSMSFLDKAFCIFVENVCLELFSNKFLGLCIASKKNTTIVILIPAMFGSSLKSPCGAKAVLYEICPNIHTYITVTKVLC